MSALVQRYLPFWSEMKGYDRAHLRGDAVAGMTTAVMLIPQSMAYAMLAGLPPIIGLYASVVPLIVYALLGTSRQLAVGPVAMVSLLVASGVGQIARVGSETFIAYAILLALMVGVLQFAMGVFRLGFLTNFLSHPVIAGFTSAAALIIGFSQLKHLLGVDIQRSHHVHSILIQAFEHISEINGITLVIGALSVAALMLLKKYKPMFPRALIVVVGGTLAVWGFGLHEAGVAIVGEVPSGFPAPSFPTFDLEATKGLLPTAIAIALVGFMESISVAKSFASKNRYEVDSNQELIALGLANVAGAFFRAYPVTGGFSRTAVNAQAGSKTTLASMVTAVVVGITLLFFTPLFHFLPKAVLAAIIMTAVFGLVDVAEFKHLFKVKRSDLALMTLTFVATLSLGIEQGILTGVIASLGWFIVRSTRPHYAVLGRLPGTSSYRNIDNYEAEQIPGVLILRFDAQFYFGNVSFLKDTLKRLESDMSEPLRGVIFDASSMNQLDSSADTALHEIAEDFEARGIELYFAKIKVPAREVMEKSGFVDRVGKAHFKLRIQDAVDQLVPEPDSDEQAIPALPRAV